jgi:hypothetical protein
LDSNAIRLTTSTIRTTIKPRRLVFDDQLANHHAQTVTLRLSVVRVFGLCPAGAATNPAPSRPSPATQGPALASAAQAGTGRADKSRRLWAVTHSSDRAEDAASVVRANAASHCAPIIAPAGAKLHTKPRGEAIRVDCDALCIACLSRCLTNLSFALQVN